MAIHVVLVEAEYVWVYLERRKIDNSNIDKEKSPFSRPGHIRYIVPALMFAYINGH